MRKYPLSPSLNSINSWLKVFFLFWKMDQTQNLLFLAIYFRFSSKKQKIIYHHVKFFLIHFVVLASQNFIRLHNNSPMWTSAVNLYNHTVIRKKAKWLLSTAHVQTSSIWGNQFWVTRLGKILRLHSNFLPAA